MLANITDLGLKIAILAGLIIITCRILIWLWSFLKEVINPEILYINNHQKVLVFHNGDKPEISILELEPFIDYAKQRRSDGREANIILKSELFKKFFK